MISDPKLSSIRKGLLEFAGEHVSPVRAMVVPLDRLVSGTCCGTDESSALVLVLHA
jgi:hypothetical protein